MAKRVRTDPLLDTSSPHCVGNISFVDNFDMPQMRLQLRLETGRKCRNAVFVPFAAADCQCLHIKVNIMHPQPQALDDAQPGTIQQFDNKLMNSGQRNNDSLRLIPWNRGRPQISK